MAASFVASTTEPAPQSLGYSTGTVTWSGIDFQAGCPVVVPGPGNNSREILSVKVDGVDAVRADMIADSSGQELTMWVAPAAAAGSKTIVIEYNYAVPDVTIATGTLVGIASHIANDQSGSASFGYQGYGPSYVDAASAVDVNAGGITLVVAANYDDPLAGWRAGYSTSHYNSTAKITFGVGSATGTPGFIQATNGGFCGLLSASFDGAATARAFAFGTIIH